MQQFLQGFDAVFSARVDAIAIGRFEDKQITRLGRVGVGQDGGIAAAEVAGEDHPEIFALMVGEAEQDKARAEDMPGIAQLEGDPLFQGERLVEFKAPGELVDAVKRRPFIGERHGIAEHGQEQRLGGMGADDLAVKAGVDQGRHPADMVDMGMGKKQIADCIGWDGKPGKGQLRVIAVGGTAVDQDIDVVGGARLGLYQVTGTGDAVFCTEMGNFHGFLVTELHPEGQIFILDIVTSIISIDFNSNPGDGSGNLHAEFVSLVKYTKATGNSHPLRESAKWW